MEVFGYILVCSIFLIMISVFCYIKSGKKMRKFILVYNIVLYAGFIVLFILNVVSDAQTRDLSQKYDMYGGTILSGWSYDKEENGYYYIHSSYLFGGDDYVVPIDTCKLSALAKYTSDIKVYTEADTNIELDCHVDIGGKTYILAENVVMIEPEYFLWTFSYTIIAGLALIIENLITLSIVIFNWIRAKRK